MRIIIASRNPDKLQAVKYGFTTVFPREEIIITPVSVPSNVSAQLLTEEETMIGAKNRAKNAQQEIPNADFWVGIEGGPEEQNKEMESFAWIYILAKNGKIGKGRTGSYFLPKK